jgi:hypothetical protein
MKLKMRISKFSSFIYYVVELFVLKTKVEVITTILLVTDFDHTEVIYEYVVNHSFLDAFSKYWVRKLYSIFPETQYIHNPIDTVLQFCDSMR